MISIWRYNLDVTDEVFVAMPAGARILPHASGNYAPDEVSIWAVVNTMKPTVNRRIVIVGTGNPADIDDLGNYIGTADAGRFIWHLFDGGEVGEPLRPRLCDPTNGSVL